MQSLRHRPQIGSMAMHPQEGLLICTTEGMVSKVHLESGKQEALAGVTAAPMSSVMSRMVVVTGVLERLDDQ